MPFDGDVRLIRPGGVYPGACLGYWEASPRVPDSCATVTDVRTGFAEYVSGNTYTASVFIAGFPDGNHFLNLTFAQDMVPADTLIFVRTTCSTVEG